MVKCGRVLPSITDQGTNQIQTFSKVGAGVAWGPRGVRARELRIGRATAWPGVHGAAVITYLTTTWQRECGGDGAVAEPQTKDVAPPDAHPDSFLCNPCDRVPPLIGIEGCQRSSERTRLRHVAEMPM